MSFNLIFSKILFQFIDILLEIFQLYGKIIYRRNGSTVLSLEGVVTGHYHPSSPNCADTYWKACVCRTRPSKNNKIQVKEVFIVKVKKVLTIFSACLVLVMALCISVSAATSTVELRRTMYYVSGASSAFSSNQAQYRGTIYTDSTADCQIYLFGNTANGSTGISSFILTDGRSEPYICDWKGPFTASRYGVTSWYAYAQPSGSSSGTGGHCTETVAPAY